MPTVAYEVIVTVHPEVTTGETEAVAEASRYLASSDTTHTMEMARIFDTNLYGSSDRDWGVGLHFTVPIGVESDKAAFERELSTLAHVETFEEVSYQPAN